MRPRRESSVQSISSMYRRGGGACLPFVTETPESGNTITVSFFMPVPSLESGMENTFTLLMVNLL